ncbi:MAG: DNA pilot protein [Microvirus sp.]|nr:MAG: DNA pilot protein [Microvirus sp.]
MDQDTGSRVVRDIATAMQLALMKAQVKSQEAGKNYTEEQTRTQQQLTRQQKVVADNAEKWDTGETGTAANKWGIGRNELFTSNITATMKQVEQEMQKISRDLSAAQLKQFQNTAPELLQQIRQQVQAGKIDLDALKNVAKMGGVEMGKMSPIIKLIIDAVRTAK